MLAGQLRHRIIIQKQTIELNRETGDRERVFKDIATVSAKISPVSVHDFVANQGEQYQVNTRITIRYRADVDTECRIYYPARKQYYRIVGVLADNKTGNDYLSLACESGTYQWSDVENKHE